MTHAAFRLSAFSDEYDPDFSRQLEGLRQNGISMTELRFVNGQSIADLTKEQVKECRARLDEGGITLSAIGSPIGKVPIEAPLAQEKERLRRMLEAAQLLGTDRIRVFSFFVARGDETKVENQVIDAMGQLCDIAASAGVTLCHENEKGIYGDTAQRCMTLYRAMGGRMPLVFDPANLIDIGQNPYPDAYETMKEGILYLHIKDSHGDCRYAPAGMGGCRIPELLARVDCDFAGREVILTLEPHLKVFDGMQGLEQDMTKIHTDDASYSDSQSAFGAAATALKQILAGLSCT